MKRGGWPSGMQISHFIVSYQYNATYVWCIPHSFVAFQVVGVNWSVAVSLFHGSSLAHSFFCLDIWYSTNLLSALLTCDCKFMKCSVLCSDSCTHFADCMPWYWHLHCPSPHLQAYNHIVTSCYKSVPSCPLAIDPSCAQQVRFGVGSLIRLQHMMQITVLSLHACKNVTFRIPNHQIPINPALQHSSWAVLPCHRDLLA